MKTTLEFELPEEQLELFRVLHASKFYDALWNIRELHHSYYKNLPDQIDPNLETFLYRLRQLIPNLEEILE